MLGKTFETRTGRRGCILTKCPSILSNPKKNDDQVRFYEYPQDPAMKLKWIRVLSLIDEKYETNSGICSMHFRESDFTVNADGRFELKSTAIPNINLDLGLIGNTIAWDIIQNRADKLRIGTTKKSEYGMISENSNYKDFASKFLQTLKESYLLKEYCKGDFSIHIPEQINDGFLEKCIVDTRESQLSAIKQFRTNTQENYQNPKQRLYIYLQEEKNRTYSQIKTQSFGRCRLCLYCFEKYNLLLFSTRLARNNDVTIRDCLISLIPSLSDIFQPNHEICYTCYDHLMIALHFFKMAFAVQGILHQLLNDQAFIFTDALKIPAQRYNKAFGPGVAGNKCVFFNCGKSRKDYPNMHQYHFPKDEALSKKWVDNSGNDNLLTMSHQQLRQKYVCADHFDDRDFKNPRTKAFVKTSAIPKPYYIIPPLADWQQPSSTSSERCYLPKGSVENKKTYSGSRKKTVPTDSDIMENKDGYSSVKAPISEEILNLAINDIENDSAEHNFAIHVAKAEPSTDGAAVQRYDDSKMVHSLDEKQKDVLNNVLATLRPIKSKDGLFTSESPSKHLSATGENEPCEPRTNSGNRFDECDSLELLDNIDELTSDDKSLIEPFNVLADLPPTDNIIGLPGGSAYIFQFTEDASFADIKIISLKKNGNQGRVILLGSDNAGLKDAPIDECSNKSSEHKNTEHGPLEEELPAENCQLKSNDDLSVSNKQTEEEMSNLQINIKCKKDDAKNLLSPIHTQESDLQFTPSAEKIKNMKNKTLTNIPDVKEELDLENLQCDVVNETNSALSNITNGPNIDPYTRNDYLNSNRDIYTINNILHSNNESSENENISTDMGPWVSNKKGDSNLAPTPMEAVRNRSVIQSTLINDLRDQDNICPQFVIVTPAISNPEDLKADCFENLKVVSLDFNVAREKRIIFMGSPFCNSCKRSKFTCKCPRLRKLRKTMCEKCGKILLSSGLKMHVSKCGKTASFTCKKCKSVFSTKAQYMNHLNRIADAPVCNFVQCKICLVKFTKADFKQHIIEHPKQYLCPKCGKSFVTSNLMSSHLRYHNKKTEKNQRKVVCQFCGKLYFNLNCHLRRHTQEKQEICDICNKRYFDKRLLRLHKKQSHSAEEFPCNICSKIFSYASGLKTHINVVHVRKPVVTCKICSMKFTRRDYYYIHMQRDHLVSGITLKFQNGKKAGPAICNICKKVFSHRIMLRNHYKNVHYRVKCGLCHLTFCNKMSKDRHEILHKNPYFQFSCKICFARNKSETELQKHMKKSHSKKPSKYQCYHCNELFGKKYLLVDHIGSKHTVCTEGEKQQ